MPSFFTEFLEFLWTELRASYKKPRGKKKDGKCLIVKEFPAVYVRNFLVSTVSPDTSDRTNSQELSFLENFILIY